MTIENFNRTIDLWIAELERYTFTQLTAKPTPASWSLGQMYQHLIDDTRFYIGQILIAIASNDHAGEEAIPFARTMLHNNEFPNEVLEGDPSNAFIPQPASKEHLLSDLVNVKTEMNNVATQMTASPYHGKSKHPGFNYLSAKEWLQFADMHLRHHLRQKKRIDTFLEANGSRAVNIS
jgi:hypothetical protein